MRDKQDAGMSAAPVAMACIHVDVVMAQDGDYSRRPDIYVMAWRTRGWSLRGLYVHVIMIHGARKHS